MRRFRSVEQMEGPHWYEPGDPRLYRALRRVWALHERTLRPRFPPGVHRHRSVEAMNALQESWDQANFAAHRRRLEEFLHRTGPAGGPARGSEEGQPP